jgi:hypothetical protein
MSAEVGLIPTREEFIAHLATLPPKRQDQHIGVSAAWVARILPLWPDGDFFLGLKIAPAAGSPVAALALSRSQRRSPCSWGHHSLALNEPSSPAFAGSSIEANGLIGGPPLDVEDWVLAVLTRLQRIPGWDELRIGALSEADTARFQQAAVALGLLSHIFSERQTYWVDLDLVRQRYGGNYLASRSANTRQQLRSALRRLCTEHGEFCLTPASSQGQGHAWLDALAGLHRQRWNARGETTGFANPAFCRYHHTFVEQMLDSGEIQILRASAGAQTLAYLYNLVKDGRVYFDMSGVEHVRHAHHKPGVLAHWQAIEWYEQRGMRTYDFQAGTNRYKQSLATHSAVQTDLVLRQPLVKFRLEAAGRWFKRRLAQRS